MLIIQDSSFTRILVLQHNFEKKAVSLKCKEI